MGKDMLETEVPLWTGIHPSAVVHDDAELAADVSVGPGAIIGPGVVVGAGTSIGSNALLERDTVVGEECVIAHGAVLGTDPQDLKFEGEKTLLVVGDRTVIREYATLNRGTRAAGRTVVGSDCLLMAYVHVAHDCQIGDHTIFGNAATLAGHVEVHDYAIINAFAGVQQFCRIGAHVYMAAHSGATKDVVPFALVQGNHAHVYGLNTKGMLRRGFDRTALRSLKKAFRLLFRQNLNTTQALEAIDEAGLDTAEVAELVAFIRASERGIVK